MGNLIRISVLLFMGIALIGVFFVGNFTETGKIIETEQYTYTKAICNESNFCQDYLISCDKDNNITKKIAITGAVTQHGDDWVDPREDSSSECGS